MERRDEVRTSIPYKKAYRFTCIHSEGFIACNSTYFSVEKHIIRLFRKGFFLAEGLQSLGSIVSFGIEIALHHIVFHIYWGQTAFGLYQYKSIHPIGDMQRHGRLSTMIYKKPWVQTFKSEGALLSWGYQRRISTSSCSRYSVKVDIVCQFVIWVIFKCKRDFIAYTSSNKTPWHSTAKCPKKILSTICQFTFFFYDFKCNTQFGSLPIAYWRWYERR